MGMGREGEGEGGSGEGWMDGWVYKVMEREGWGGKGGGKACMYVSLYA